MPQTDCPKCTTVLAAGAAVLFSGDVLVHARCWTDSDNPPEKATGEKKSQRPAE